MDGDIGKIFVGSILGDGFLEKPCRNGSRLVIKYDDKSFEYLRWLHTKLKPFGVSEIKKKLGYNQHYFSTKPSLEAANYWYLFYPKGKKTVPNSIQEILNNPLSLAIWYMDDGNLDNRPKYHCNSSFATFCFSYKECILLSKTLEKNFGIETRVHLSSMRGKRYYRLYVISKSMKSFMKIIQKFIIPCMRYKTYSITSSCGDT